MQQKQRAKKRASHINWRSKLLLLFWAFSLAPTAGLGCWVLQSLGDQAERDAFERISGLAKAKTQAIDQLVSDRIRQVETIATLLAADMDALAKAKTRRPSQELSAPQELKDANALEDLVPTAPAEGPAGPAKEQTDTTPAGPPPSPGRARIDKRASPAEEAVESLRKTLGLILWDRGEYEEILIIEPSGIVAASTFRGHEGKTAANIDYFTKGRLSTFIQPVFVSPLTEQLTMVVATPIKNAARNPIGVLAARLNLDNFFRLIGDQTGLGSSGETVVVKKMDSEVVFMAPTRHDDGAALKRKVSMGSVASVALQDAARGQVGSGPSIDYRRRKVFAAWQHIPSLDWGLVVKIDQAESRALVLAARTHAMLLAIAIALLGFFCAAAVSRRMVRSLRELREATDKISKGDLDVKLKIRSGDEVGDLADSFERMIAAIKFFKEGGKDE